MGLCVPMVVAALVMLLPLAVCVVSRPLKPNVLYILTDVRCLTSTLHPASCQAGVPPARP